MESVEWALLCLSLQLDTTPQRPPNWSNEAQRIFSSPFDFIKTWERDVDAFTSSCAASGAENLIGCWSVCHCPALPPAPDWSGARGKKKSKKKKKIHHPYGSRWADSTGQHGEMLPQIRALCQSIIWDGGGEWHIIGRLERGGGEGEGECVTHNMWQSEGAGEEGGRRFNLTMLEY